MIGLACLRIRLWSIFSLQSTNLKRCLNFKELDLHSLRRSQKNKKHNVAGPKHTVNNNKTAFKQVKLMNVTTGQQIFASHKAGLTILSNSSNAEVCTILNFLPNYNLDFHFCISYLYFTLF